MAGEIVQKETKLANGWLAWRVEGRIDISNAESVYLSGEKIVEREDKTVLDMEAVSYISSAGLRVLLGLSNKAKREGKEFAIARAADTVKKILIYSRMNLFLNMRPSLDDL